MVGGSDIIEKGNPEAGDILCYEGREGGRAGRR